MVPDLDPDKPDPDPVWPDLDPAISGSGSGLPGSRSGNIRIWIRLLPDLDPVAAGSKVPHGLSGLVQALPAGCHRVLTEGVRKGANPWVTLLFRHQIHVSMAYLR